MPRFPKKEAEISELAKQMIVGFNNHAADFPSVHLHPLISVYNLYISLRDSQVDAFSAAKLATEAKEDKLQVLKEVMKNDLKKSEVDVADEPEKLALIGWGPPKLPQSVQRAGQPINLYSANQGEGEIVLKWDNPADGGAIRNYIVQQRFQEEVDGEFSVWRVIANSFQNEIFLTNQPQRITLEYRVKAVNISGESLPSNVVAAVL